MDVRNRWEICTPYLIDDKIVPQIEEAYKMAPDEVRNERRKNWATWLNNMSVACFTVGVLGPFFGAVGNTQSSLSTIAAALPAYLFADPKGNIMLFFLMLCALFRFWAWWSLSKLTVSS